MNLNYKTYIGSACKRNYEESVNHLMSLLELYNKFIAEPKDDFKKGKKGSGSLVVLGSCYGGVASQSLVEFNDVESFKQNIYVCAKLHIMSSYRMKDIHCYLAWQIFLSDSPELMEYIRSNSAEFKKEYNKLTARYGGIRFYYILLALDDDWEQLEKSVTTLLESNKKTQARYIPDYKFFLSMCKKDIQGMEEALNMLLVPKVARRRMYDLDVDFDFYLNIIVLTYAKIAALKGFNLNIDHPTAPEELIVYAPLKEYKDPYDFMQEYSFDTHLEWGEKRIQIEHEANMEAKKLKNRIKAKFKRLFRIGE